MSDPPIPEPNPADHEDVSWALSTAAANWKRGDHADALRWLQRAAESASEAGLDLRYLELAKAAAELAAKIESSPRLPSLDRRPAAPLPSRTSAPPVRPSVAPRVTAAPTRPSNPPRTSSPPRASAAPRPSGTPARTSNAPALPTAAKKDKSEERKQRASRPNIQRRGADGARSAKSGGPAAERPAPVTRRVDPEDMTQLSPSSVAPHSSPPPVTEAQPEYSVVLSEPSSADVEIEPWPTQASAKGKNPYAYVPHQDDTIVAPPARADLGPETPRSAKPKELPRPRRPPVGDSDPTLIPNPDDPVPMQALRVVLYRTADGVRVGLPGKRMEAMSIDAMLVALDAHIDLASWLK